MSVYLLLTFASFLLYVQAGIYILLVLPRSRQGVSFAAVSWLMAIYSLSAFILQLQHEPDTLYLVDRFSNFSVLALAIIFNVFLSALRNRYERYLEFAIYFLLLPFAIVLLLKNMIDPASIKSFVFNNDHWYFVVNRHSVWAHLFVIFSLLSYLLNMLQIYLWHRQSKTNRERIQTRIIFVAIMVFLIVILVAEVIMVHWDFYRIPTTFHIIAIPLVGTILYTLTNKRFQLLPGEIVTSIVMNRLHAFVLFIDSKGQVFGTNKYSQDILGYGGIAIKELASGALFSNIDDCHQLLDDASNTVPVYNRNIELLTKDLFRIRIKASAIRIGNLFGKFTGFVIVARNYEYLKRLEGRIVDKKHIVRSLEKLHKEREFVLMKRKQEMSEASISLNAEVIESNQAKKHIEQAILEKEELIKEIHHRVKNNLQIIMSLARITRLHRNLTTENHEVINAIIDRLHVISNIHEDFYVSDVLSKIAFGQYLRSLVMKIHAQNRDLHNLVFKMNVTDDALSINQAIPSGIIAYELIVNTLDHAFQNFPASSDGVETTSVVGVEFFKNHGLYSLIIYDNGVGISDTWREKESPGSGLHLVEVLANEFLQGDLEIENSFGTRISLTFTELNETR